MSLETDAGRSPGFRLEVLPEGEWARTVAAWFTARLQANPALRVCLPTGDTPSPVYAELVAAEWAGAVSLAGATVVLLDEWVGLPPGDAARCDARLGAELLDQVGGEVRRFVAIDVDGGDLEAAVAALDLAARDLDLAVVGLGMNGHVGFNEPGSLPADGSRVLPLADASSLAASVRYGASSRPVAGITIGLARLLEARECWLLVTGERKAAILQAALEGPETSSCPASFLRRHPALTVFADEPAAALLARS